MIFFICLVSESMDVYHNYIYDIGKTVPYNINICSSEARQSSKPLVPRVRLREQFSGLSLRAPAWQTEQILPFGVEGIV